jgi:hypothetical protein
VWSRLCQLPLYVPPALITIGGDGVEELAVEVGPTDCERAGEPQRLATIAPARRAKPFLCGKGSGILEGPMKASGWGNVIVLAAAASVLWESYGRSWASVKPAYRAVQYGTQGLSSSHLAK